MDNDAPTAGVQWPNALRPDTGATRIDGAPPASHPELRAAHPDNVALRIDAPELNGEYTAFPYPNHPGAPMDHAPASAWSTRKLSTGGD